MVTIRSTATAAGFVVLGLLASGAAAHAQDSVPAAATAAESCDLEFRVMHGRRDLSARVRETSGGQEFVYGLFRRDGDPVCSAPGTRIQLLPVRLTTVARSGYAGGENDGSLWQGRGLSAAASVGLYGRAAIFEAAFAPEMSVSTNLPFDSPLPPAAVQSPFAHPLYAGRLDMPVRMGDDPYSRLGLGQSFARVTVGVFTAGVSSQNIWIGPGLFNSLLMSNNAPGFPHATFGTARPVSIGIGSIFAQVVGGRLSESAFYDTVSSNNHDALSLLHVGFVPAGVPNLQIGFTRVFVLHQDDGFDLGSVLRPLVQALFKNGLATPDNPSGNDPEDNQLLAASARWVLAGSGFEVYGEAGREDHAASVEDFIQEPDHAWGYVAGAQKTFPARGGVISVGAELTSLQHYTPPRPERSMSQWYLHRDHGYSHAGQLLGAAVGPGGDQRSAYVTWLDGDRFSRLYFHDALRNGPMRYRQPGRGADREWRLGGQHARTIVGRLEAMAAVEAAGRANRLFTEDGISLSATLGLTYSPGR
jgi:hypothetical protein